MSKQKFWQVGIYFDSLDKFLVKNQKLFWQINIFVKLGEGL
jgi:hypothetical protein